MRYMLITVCDREIATEIFYSFDAARNKMLDGVWDELVESGDYDLDEEKKFLNDESHIWHDNWNNNWEVLEFGKNYAWSNVNDDYPMDWKIVEIPD